MTTRTVHSMCLKLFALGATAFISTACGSRESYIPNTVAASYAAKESPSEVATLSFDRKSSAQPRASSAAMALAAPVDTEAYAAVFETGFQHTRERPKSTFSVDVDTAAYSNVRRFIASGYRPPADAVRIEELINYFDYDYAPPSAEHPIAIDSELSASPFDRRLALLRVGLSAADVERAQDPPKNLAFLIDVSGSMRDENKLPLLKRALSLLVEQLEEQDRVSIVVYAGESGVALPPTAGDEHDAILDAIDRLQPGGSTNGGAGIELAYQLARMHLRPNAINRVILATDGDFNVGVTSSDALYRLIENQRDHGVYLTVLGFGMGNLKDETMEMLADHGNGNYAYIDTLREARKVLVDEASATLRTVAKDAKLQLTWNPRAVSRYRLIGYENRRLADEDFADDRKDAGDLGDGHRVTALYEVELSRGFSEAEPLVAIDVRYKRPGEDESRVVRREVRGAPCAFEDASEDLRFASAVAGFGMLLRDSPHRGQLDFDAALAIARDAIGRDPFGYRHELVALLEQAQNLYAR